MKMRELEDRTGVDREVIRIMIREGLLPEPIRPARNAAEYDESHVSGIATIRHLQQTSRLTLKEIKAALSGQSLERPGPASIYSHLETLLSRSFGLEQPATVSLQSLCERYPRAEHDAHTFESMGMLTLIRNEHGYSLSLTDARLVEIWGKIREAGFVEEQGFPPENISFYREAAELVAQHETSIFFRGSDGAIGEEDAARMLETALPLMLDFFGLLRIKAFMASVHRSVKKEEP
ncbi:MerR family transcriptional regulator [Sphingobium baderi LL03]|nr:MerR family transcriptional regulator [Sphingobium baderi]KMS60962.1 MerR family transcriptional regulator [Sphingobium baderi LL03]